MTIKAYSLLPMTDTEANTAREALKTAGIRATVRRGQGSCRWKLYVTPKNKSVDYSPIVQTMTSIGFTFKWRDSWDGKCHFEKRGTT